MNDKSAPKGDSNYNADAETDSNLAALYAKTQRNNGEQPSEQLDASVLDLAAKEASSGDRGYKRWFVPQSLVATLALAVGVGVIFHQEREEILSPEPRALELPAPKTILQRQQPVADSILSESIGELEGNSIEEAKAKKEASQIPSRASMRAEPTIPASEDSAAQLRNRSPSAPAAERATVLDVLEQSSDKVIVEKADAESKPQFKSKPKPNMPSLPAKKTSELETSEFRYNDSDSSGREMGLRKDARPSSKQEEDSALGSSLAPLDELDPDSWLEGIYSLYEDGELGEARIELIEFQHRYPEYELPTELRLLLQR